MYCITVHSTSYTCSSPMYGRGAAAGIRCKISLQCAQFSRQFIFEIASKCLCHWFQPSLGGDRIMGRQSVFPSPTEGSLCPRKYNAPTPKLWFSSQPLTESLLSGSPLIPGPQRDRYKEKYNSMDMLMESAELSSSFLPNKTGD